MIMHFHKGLAFARWQAFPWDKKILHIASELIRARNCIRTDHREGKGKALERALELIDASLADASHPGSRSFLREFLRMREAVSGFYVNPVCDPEELTQLIRGLLDLHGATHNLKLKL
ncbi:MAG: hypothetical protein NC930_08305 [Candidatus Omnitrophica bacterium]|nr:hypothetical protein [Candidatus Omnitrophota bacterium]